MKNNTLIWISLLICALILGFFYLDNNGCFNPKDDAVKVDTVFTTKTDTLWKDTTIIQKDIVPKIIVKTKVDTLFSKDGDTIQLVTEQKRFDKTIISNKDTAEVQVYTSGIKTSLDSLKMRFKTHSEIITNTVEITKEVRKKKTFWNRFHIGLQGGYGYAFKSKELTPYIGVGASFDL